MGVGHRSRFAEVWDEAKHLKTVLIVYHSMTGGTRQMAEAALAGARDVDGINVNFRRAEQAEAGDVVAADGFIFATPENLAAMSGMLKDFFDRTYYAALDKLNGRPYLIMICAGSDGQGAARQIERIATGWRLKPVAEPFIVCTRATLPAQILAAKTLPHEALRTCKELGETLSSGLSLGIF
jgi:multimeric flavodoxin WrbA